MESFDEAVTKLRRLLREHGRPSEIAWLDSSSPIRVLGCTFVRTAAVNYETHVRSKYEVACSDGHAVALDVLGHSVGKSFVQVAVEEDERTAELRMMSTDHVKLSVPHDVPRRWREVHSGAAWAALKLLSDGTGAQD